MVVTAGSVCMNLVDYLVAICGLMIRATGSSTRHFKYRGLPLLSEWGSSPASGISDLASSNEVINDRLAENLFPKSSERILLLFSRRISPIYSEISLVIVEVSHAGLAPKRSPATDGNEDFLLEKSLFVERQYSS
jgi:hypothetical protein